MCGSSLLACGGGCWWFVGVFCVGLFVGFFLVFVFFLWLGCFLFFVFFLVFLFFCRLLFFSPHRLNYELDSCVFPSFSRIARRFFDSANFFPHPSFPQHLAARPANYFPFHLFGPLSVSVMSVMLILE